MSLCAVLNLTASHLPVSSLAGYAVVSTVSKRGPQALLGCSDFLRATFAAQRMLNASSKANFVSLPIDWGRLSKLQCCLLACDQSWSSLWCHFLFLNSRQKKNPKPLPCWVLFQCRMEYTHLRELVPAAGLGQVFDLGSHYFNFVIQSSLQGTILSWRENWEDNISLLLL